MAVICRNRAYPLTICAMLVIVVGSAPMVSAQQTTSPTERPYSIQQASLHHLFRYTVLVSSDDQETANAAAPLYLMKEQSDRWIAYDKLQHVTFSFLVTLSSQYVLVNKLNWQHPYGSLVVSSGLSAGLGISKELYDANRHGLFSTRDLAADAVGILLASGLILL